MSLDARLNRLMPTLTAKELASGPVHFAPSSRRHDSSLLAASVRQT